MKNKSIDDLTGVLGAVAGLANDMRQTLTDKAKKAENIWQSQDEINRLTAKIDELEIRIIALESQQKDRKS